MADPDDGPPPGSHHSQPRPPPAPSSSSSSLPGYRRPPPPPPPSVPSGASLPPEYFAMRDNMHSLLRGTASSPSTPPGPGSGSGVPPLHITVRFLSLPDIQLDVTSPDRVTVASLRSMVRTKLSMAAQMAANDSSKPTDASKTPTKNNPLSPSSPSLADAHKRTLRFFYGGKMLFDRNILSSVIRPVAPPPRNLSASPASSNDDKTASSHHHHRGDSSSANAPRVYVSCSLGDLMADKDLAAEVILAASPPSVFDTASKGGTSSASAAAGTSGMPSSALRTATPPSAAGFNSSRGGRLSPGVGAEAIALLGAGSGGGAASGSAASSAVHSPSTTPVPRGFERLLQAGFTAAEVNQLRLQFRSIQESRFTPDNMPSPDSLRNLEENWLDNNHGGMGGAGGGGGGGGGFGGSGMMDSLDGTSGGSPGDDEFGLPGLMDIMVRGMLIGFLFPMGSAGWLAREEGLWTRKWQVFVSFGVVLSLTIGTIKTLAGE